MTREGRCLEMTGGVILLLSVAGLGYGETATCAMENTVDGDIGKFPSELLTTSVQGWYYSDYSELPNMPTAAHCSQFCISIPWCNYWTWTGDPGGCGIQPSHRCRAIAGDYQGTFEECNLVSGTRSCSIELTTTTTTTTTTTETNACPDQGLSSLI